MVEGASGHMENDAERMVKTPWFDYEVPFTQAAEIGTKKVINEHSTIGIVIAADGTFTDIPRENYAAPEEKTVNELKKLGKPFIVLLNSTKPYSDETKELAQQMQEKYQVAVLPVMLPSVILMSPPQLYTPLPFTALLLAILPPYILKVPQTFDCDVPA